MTTNQSLIDTSRTFFTRPAKPGDRGRIEALWKEFSRPDEEFLNVALDPDHEHTEYNQVFVAVAQNDVVGFGAGVQCGPDWLTDMLEVEAIAHMFVDTMGYFHTLVVAPNWRGQGIGTALGRQRLEWLRSNDVSHCFGVSWQREDGPTSAPLFEKLGFEEVAYIREYYYQEDDPRRWCPDCGEPCSCDAKIYGRFP